MRIRSLGQVGYFYPLSGFNYDDVQLCSIFGPKNHDQEGAANSEGIRVCKGSLLKGKILQKKLKWSGALSSFSPCLEASVLRVLFLVLSADFCFDM